MGTRGARDGELELVSAVYDAAAEPGGWSALLDRLVETTGSSAATMSFNDPRAPEPFRVVVSRVDPAWLENEYANHFAAQDPVLPFMSGARVGAFNYAAEAVDPEVSARTEFYHEYGRHILRYDSALLLTGEFRTAFSGLCLMRTRERGAYRPGELDHLEYLAPHLARAVAIERRLFNAEARKESLLVALDGFATGVFLLDTAGRLLEHNRSGVRLLRTGRGLRVSGARLCAESHSAQKKLDQAIRECAATADRRGSGAGGWVQLPSAGREQPLAALVSPIRGHVARQVPSLARVVVYVNDPEIEPLGWEQVARATWGLTAQEARIAGLLAHGLDVDDIADRLSVQRDTVRTHLKRCFNKVDVRRQSQLVAALWRTAGALLPPLAE